MKLNNKFSQGPFRFGLAIGRWDKETNISPAYSKDFDFSTPQISQEKKEYIKGYIIGYFNLNSNNITVEN